MSDSDGIYFRVEIEWAWGNTSDAYIGPIPEEELDEHGNPTADDLDEAVWRIINDKISWERVEKSEMPFA